MTTRPKASSVSIEELQQAIGFTDRLYNLTSTLPKFRSGKADAEEQKDPQRGRVYAAEAAHSRWGKGRFTSFSQLKDFVSYVDESGWYRERFGERKITVMGGEPGQVAALGGLFSISIPSRYRRRLVVLHEIAHAICWTPGSRVENHGPEFCAIYLILVEQFMGMSAADELLEIFNSRSVRIAPRSKLRFKRSTERQFRRSLLALV